MAFENSYADAIDIARAWYRHRLKQEAKQAAKSDEVAD